MLESVGSVLDPVHSILDPAHSILDPAHLGATVAWLGFGLALVFGAVAHRVNFCTMGAVSDVVNIGDWGRMRMWLLAIAVAMLGANLLHLFGYVDLERSIYPVERFSWLSYALGGFLFGVGMTLAGGCGSRNLVRLGGGNLKSLVVLTFLAVSAYMTMKGLLAVPRAGVLDPVALHFDGGQGVPNLLARLAPMDGRTARWVATGLVVGALLLFVLKDREFRRSRELILGGAVIGLVIAAGWYVTGHLGYLSEDPETLEEIFAGTNTRRPESFSFVGPVGYSLELLLLWTDSSLRVTFGVAVVAGLPLGSAAYALATRNFRWETFASAADLRNNVLGGLLMGFGGVTALGCTIGQGLSGVSTLALGSFLALAAIVTGSALTMKWLYWRLAAKG
ncbi:MAG TPA: YeeE/YedE family protein [Burkholderiales bacterium]|nr:YeeE/YedE family protein [Burkholderiales bacterium]